MAILLAPPRRSIDLDSWSLYDGERSCLEGVPEPRWDSKDHRDNPIEPLRAVKRRDSAAYIPMCALPKKRDSDWSTRPVPLTSRAMRQLAKQRADQLRAERIAAKEQQAAPSQPIIVGVEKTSKRHATFADLPAGQLPSPRFRRTSVNLPPILLNDLTDPDLQRNERPHSSPVHSRVRPPQAPRVAASDSGRE